MLRFIAFSDRDAEVRGLDRVPRELWPPVTIVHFLSFSLLYVFLGVVVIVLLQNHVLASAAKAAAADERGHPKSGREAGLGVRVSCLRAAAR